MRFAVVESGGKQYRVTEGERLEVDLLPDEPGKKFEFDRVLLMADEDEVLVGTPVVSAVQVKATVLEHFRGPKVVAFRYSPKKRIRVKSGHRQHYTRLLVDFIGRAGEERKREPVQTAAKPTVSAQPKKSAKAAAPRKTSAKTVAKKAVKKPSGSKK